MARNNDARQRVRSSPQFSEEEKVAMLRAIDMDDMGITPGTVPADPNKMRFKEGRAPGDEFQDQGGNWHMVQPDGSIKMTLRWDQGPEAAKMKYEAEQRKTEMAQHEARGKEWLKLITMRKEVPGKPGVEEPVYGEDEIQAMLDRVFPTTVPPERMPPLDIPGTAELIGGRQQQLPVPRNLIGDLPEFVGLAQAFMREVQNRTQRGIKISPRMSGAIQEAQAILLRHAARGSS